MIALTLGEPRAPVATTEPSRWGRVDGPSLLPDPNPSAAGDLDDAMGCVYAALSWLQGLDVQSAQESVAENHTLQAAALADERAALKRQEANEAGAGRGFFSSLGHLVSDVAGDLARGEMGRALGDAGKDLGEAWNSPRFWSDLATGLKDIAAVADGIATVGQAIGGEAGAVVGAAAGEVSDVATAGATLAGARGEHFAAEVVEARADATSARDAAGSLQTLAGWTLDDLKAAEESRGGALDALRGAIGTGDRTWLVTVSSQGKG